MLALRSRCLQGTISECNMFYLRLFGLLLRSDYTPLMHFLTSVILSLDRIAVRSAMTLVPVQLFIDTGMLHLTFDIFCIGCSKPTIDDALPYFPQ